MLGDLWIAACARDTASEWPAISDLSECGLQEGQQLDDAIGAVGDDFDCADHDICSDHTLGLFAVTRSRASTSHSTQGA